MRIKCSPTRSTSSSRAALISALTIVVLAFGDSDAGAQQLTLEYQQTVTWKIEGATAAFSLDPSRVAVSAQNGDVTIVGRGPGATHIVVVVGDHSQSFQISVNQPPIVNFIIAHGADSAAAATSLYDVRYTSEPGILQGSLRASRREGDRTTEVWLGGATPLASDTPESPFSFPLAAYTVRTPAREITFLDAVVANSPLTVSRANVRGIHLREGPWQLHAGYSLFANFEHVLLPTNKEAVAGVGYRYRLGRRTTLTPNFYSFSAQSTDSHNGPLGTLLYETAPGKNARILAELGMGRALGGALEVDINRSKRHLWGNIRFAPPNLPSLTADQQSGRQMEGHWTQYGERVSINANVSSRAFTQGSADQTSSVAGFDLQYRPGKWWSLNGGSGYAAFDTSGRPELKVQSITLPLGVQFAYRSVGAGLDYQFANETNRSVAGHLIRTSANATRRGFHMSAYAERQTQAPTASHILATVPWLQQMFDRLGLSANTPEQLTELLRMNAEISAYGYANALIIHVTPVRSRASASIGWSGSGTTRPQLFASSLINRDEAIDRTSRGAVHTLSYSQRVGSGTEMFANWSLLCTNYPQPLATCRPAFTVSLRQTLGSAPRLLLPQRQGSIQGVVFRDDRAAGVYSQGLPTVRDVDVMLDGVRQTRTDGDGRFHFGGVPYGRHRVEVRVATSESLFFTTPSPVDVETDSTVNFGVGTRLSGLRAEVHSDVGSPLAGVVVRIAGAGRELTAQTSDDGVLVANGLPDGIYDVTLGSDSVPPGYRLEDIGPQRVAVGINRMGLGVFVLQPQRSVTGQVRAFDRSGYVSVPGATVELCGSEQTSVTDARGVYMLRDIPPGAQVVRAIYRGEQQVVRIRVPDGPALLKDVDVVFRSATAVLADRTDIARARVDTVLAEVAPDSFVIQNCSHQK